MSKLNFSLGKAIFENNKFANGFFAGTLEDILKLKDNFTGFIRIDKTRNIQSFLFFLKSRCYAAGEISRSKPVSTSIGEFFDNVSSSTGAKLSISLYETDPVLLKGILVFIQMEPTVKAATNLIDLENIMNQIQKDRADSFVVLKKHDILNFFFFKDGKAVISRFADTDFKADKSLSILENLLIYAYPAKRTAVEALIYRDIKTSPAEDSESINIEDIIKILRKTESKKTKVKTETGKKKRHLEFEVIEGAQNGEKFNVALPCVIGRKGCDVNIKDPKVSRKHANIKEINGRKIIEDLKSTNGSFVNGKKIKTKELQSGDLILLGDTKIRISF
jgi:hypothetical protein